VNRKILVFKVGGDVWTVKKLNWIIFIIVEWWITMQTYLNI
jgi:hypothetical protein